MNDGGRVSEDDAQDALRHLAEQSGAVDEDEDDPFTCPVCGGSVVVSGTGARDCKNCPWDERPDPVQESKQSGITQFQE